MRQCVKCADCGFLAVRITETRELVDAEMPLRTDGSLSTHSAVLSGGFITTNATMFDTHHVCFVQAFDLVAETGIHPADAQRKAMVLNQRDCHSFTPWQQGFTPKEHRQMLSLKEEREERQKFYERERDERNEDRVSERRWRWFEIISIIVLVPFTSALFTYLEHRYEEKPQPTQKQGTIPGTVATDAIEPKIATPDNK